MVSLSLECAISILQINLFYYTARRAVAATRLACYAGASEVKHRRPKRLGLLLDILTTGFARGA